MTYLSKVFVTLCCALGAVEAAAQLYSWKDAQGKTHYSDTPPAKAQAKETRNLRNAAPAATAATKASADPLARAVATQEKKEKNEAAAAKAEEQMRQTAEKRENCAKAKANYAAIDSGAARFSINEKGEKIALDGDVRAKAFSDAQEAVAKFCNS